jgi:hypothetical protein
MSPRLKFTGIGFEADSAKVMRSCTAVIMSVVKKEVFPNRISAPGAMPA